MKKILLLLIGFAFYSTAYSQAKKGYDIAVKINGLSCSDELLLANHYGDKQYLKDTSSCENGVFHFKGDERLESGVYLIVLPKKSYFEFLISSDEEQTTYYLETDTTLKVSAMKVKGSKENELFLKFNKFAADQGRIANDIDQKLKLDPEGDKADLYKKQLGKLGEEVATFRQKIASDNPNMFIGRLYTSMKAIEPLEVTEDVTSNKAKSMKYLHMRDHYFDNIDMSEDGIVRSPVFYNKLKDYFANYVPPIVDTTIMLADRLIGQIDAGGSKEQYKYAVHYLLGYFEKADYMCFDKGLWHMAKNYYCDGKAWWSDSAFIAKMCEESAKMEPTLCDVVAPDLNMPDSNFNKRIRMSEITTPVTVLVFWDINCGHCKKEMPIISQFYDSANKEHVELYAIYTQGDWEGWKKRIVKDSFNFINVANAFGEDKFRKNYNIISTPQVYILDKDKKIKFKKVGAKNIAETVQFLLQDQGVIEPPISKGPPKKMEKSKEKKGKDKKDNKS